MEFVNDDIHHSHDDLYDSLQRWNDKSEDCNEGSLETRMCVFLYNSAAEREFQIPFSID